MKRTYFIKHDQRIRRIIGCDRATLIFDRLEFYSSRQPDGFYKFIEPNSHKLYKKDDSWTELLACHRTSFWRAFKLIGKKHISRWTFEESEDKFEGKLYASYYDRNTNRMFFVRNHDAVKELLVKIQPGSKLGDKSEKSKDKSQSCPGSDQTKNSLRTEQNARSNKEPEKTPSELFKNNSHASNEIIKKMIEIWTAIAQEGKGCQIELKGKIIPFLKKALKDKFNNCLQKWKEYCITIARSKFLMGEKTSWKADLAWALKFESIRKVLSGDYYGIGDRSRKLTPEELEELEQKRQEQKKSKELEQQRSLQALEEEIKNNQTEPDSIKNFRIKWLRSLGEENYREFLADCEMKIGEDETDLIILPQQRMTALKLGGQWNPELLSDQSFKRVQIYHCFTGLTESIIYDRWFGGIEEMKEIEQRGGKSINPANGFDESPDEKQSAETNQLRASLKEHIPIKPYPVWLDEIKVRTINPDGILVVTFKDKLASDYARIRFSEGILKSAVELWGEVAGLIIHEESDYLSVHDENECLGIDEGTLMKKAIQSLMGAGLAGGQGKTFLNDDIPY